MVIGQKKYTGVGNKLEKRIIEIVGESSMVRSFENGLKNFQEKKDYLIFDNDLGKKTYTIYSSELKKGICEALKDYIRISGFGEEEFVVEIKKGNEKEFGFEINDKDRKDKEKSQITYPIEPVSDASKIKDLTEKEAQKFQDEGVKSVSSSQVKDRKENKKETERNDDFKQSETKDGSQGGKDYGGKLGIFFGLVGFGLIGLVGVVSARMINK
jgi:hypothetical protein